MPATYTDQFFVMDPGGPPAAGTALATVKIDFVDGNDNGFIDTLGFDTVGGLTVTSVWVGDTITVVMDGVTQTITGVTFYVNGGQAVFTPTDGTLLTDAVFQSSTWVNTSTQMPVGGFGPPCFTPGTLIAGPDRDIAVEDLAVGDLVLTLDHGPQPVRWIGRRTVSGLGPHAPVRFAPAAIGNRRTLEVSPQHRILVSGWQSELVCGEPEVLVPAIHFIGREGVSRSRCASIDYIHLMFDRHEIVTSEGIHSESFNPGSLTLDHDRAALAEIAALFPELAEAGLRRALPLARPLARGIEGRALAG